MGKALPLGEDAQEPRLELGAFGKHPGWDDHIQAPELIHAALEPLRRALYLEGIGGAIDTGLWANLADEERLDRFDHVFIWRTPRDIYLGRMWSSTDGKGRSRYPMVACAWCSGYPLPWLLENVLPLLEDIESRCKATESADDVRVAVVGARQRLRELGAGASRVAEPLAPNPRALAEIADRPEMGPDHQGVHRILYVVAREMATYATRVRSETAFARAGSFRAQQIRVPDCAPSKNQALLLWLGFFLDQLDPSAPMLVFGPMDQPWVDLVVGEPDVQQFLCVKASRKTVPLASDIPYTLDPDLVARFETEIIQSRQGETPEAPRRKPLARPKAPKPTPRPAPAPTGEKRSPLRFLRRLWPLLIVAAVAAGILAIPFGSDAPPEKNGKTTALAPENGEQWRALCLHTHYWFARFHRTLDEERRDRWLADPVLREAMQALVDADGADRELDPRRIAGLSGGDLRRLATAPPRDMAARAGDVAAALQIAQGISSAYLGKLRALRTEWRKQDWTGPAAMLDAAVEPLSHPIPDAVNGKMMARAFDMDRKGPLGVITARMATLRDAQNAADQLGPEAGKQVRAQVRALVACAEDVVSLAASLDTAATALEPVAVAGRDMQALRARIEKTGGKALGETFERCVRSSVTTAADLAALGAALDGVKKRAAAIADQLGAARDASQAVTRIAGEKAGARLWDLAVGKARAASEFTAFSVAVAKAHEAIASIVEQLGALPKAGEALAFLGDAPQRLRDQQVRQAVEGAEDLAQAAVRIAAVGRASAEAAKAAEPVAAIHKEFGAAADPILAQFQQYVVAEVARAESLAALAATLRAAAVASEGALGVVRGDWKTRIERERFQKESTVHRAFKGKGKLTATVLADWAREARGYVRLRPDDDPRRDAAYWADALDDLRWRIALLSGHTDAKKKALGQTCAQELAAIERQIAGGRGLPWTTVNEASIRKVAVECRTKHQSLRDRLRDVVEPPEEWLPRVRQLTTVGESAAVDAEWVKRRDAIVLPTITAAELRTPAGRYEKRWVAVRKLQTLLTQLAETKALPHGLPDVPGVPAESPTRRGLVRRVEAEREKALAAVAGGIAWQDDGGVPMPGLLPDWAKAAEGYAKFRNDAAGLLVGLGRVEKLLDAGYLLTDPPDDGLATAAQAYAQCRTHPLFAGLEPPVAARVAALEEVMGLGREPLIERAVARKKGGAPEILIALWQRLGKSADWPATADELAVEAAVRADLRAFADTVKGRDEARARALGVSLDREGPRRWAVALNRLVQGADAEVLDDAGLAKVLDVREAFGVRLRALDPLTQLRVRLLDLRRAAGALPRNAAKADVDKVAKAFVDESVGLPKKLLAQTDVTRLLGRLNVLVVEKEQTDPGAGLKKAGPGGCMFASQWKARVYEGGQAIVFTWGGKGHALKFVRVRPKGAPACYLCTTEVSVGLFIDGFKVTGKWADATGLLHAFEETTRPKGPRTWVWKGRNTKVVALAPGWMYKGPEVPAPTVRHPLNYVSAGGALYFASLLGCRLPTVSEWRAASDEHADRQRNLRDATWRRQLEAVRERVARRPALRPVWPDHDIFWPPGVVGLRHDRAQVVSNGSDEVLWLAPVGNGAVFRHLVGNVAELVRTDATDVHKEAEALHTWKRADYPNLDNVRTDSFRVIGGSALSPPELWDGKAKPFHTAWPVDQR
ncbi:hypothetical protein HQ560_15045, partial [bacterium]|nr:hypothetical protein [bacterium]